MTGLKQSAVKSIKHSFSKSVATSFGGLGLVMRLALRLGLWNEAAKQLGERRGRYDWVSILTAAAAGLLTGARGTYATQAIREDAPAQRLLGLRNGAPEEATFWRALGELGAPEALAALSRTLSGWTRRVLERLKRAEFFYEGFATVFADASLLEGSPRREGTKTIPDKGSGLLWATVFVGPFLAAQRLCAQGEGEQSALRDLMPRVLEDVLAPLRLARHALWLMDSLHGDGPTLAAFERDAQHYIVGANKLSRTQATLSQLPEAVWEDTGARKSLGWETSAVCVCYLQCEDWSQKRVLVARRWKHTGEFLWQYAGVLTNLREQDVAHVGGGSLSFARAIWRLYDYKAACENHYKNLLEDMGLHHPPCREHARNAAFYAIGALAHTLFAAVDRIGGRGEAERGATQRRDGGARKRPVPRSQRLWRLCRRLFAIPASVSRHGREARVTLFDPGPAIRAQYERFWLNVCRC